LTTPARSLAAPRSSLIHSLPHHPLLSPTRYRSTSCGQPVRCSAPGYRRFLAVLQAHEHIVGQGCLQRSLEALHGSSSLERGWSRIQRISSIPQRYLPRGIIKLMLKFTYQCLPLLSLLLSVGCVLCTHSTVSSSACSAVCAPRCRLLLSSPWVCFSRCCRSAAVYVACRRRPATPSAACRRRCAPSSPACRCQTSSPTAGCRCCSSAGCLCSSSAACRHQLSSALSFSAICSSVSAAVDAAILLQARSSSVVVRPLSVVCVFSWLLPSYCSVSLNLRLRRA